MRGDSINGNYSCNLSLSSRSARSLVPLDKSLHTSLKPHNMHREHASENCGRQVRSPCDRGTIIWDEIRDEHDDMERDTSDEESNGESDVGT